MHTDIQPWQENPDQIFRACSLEVAALLQYWLNKCGGKKVVRRSDVDPLDLKPWMGRLTVLETLRGGEDFRYRLAGTTIVAKSGLDLTGRSIARDSYKCDGNTALRDLQTFVLSERPRYRADRAIMSSGRAIMAERLALPVSTDGTAVDQILTLVQSIEVISTGDAEQRGLFSAVG